MAGLARDRRARQPHPRPAARPAAADRRRAVPLRPGAAAARGAGPDLRALRGGDRDELIPQVEELGTPVEYVAGTTTAVFGIAYDGDRRFMRMEAIGDPWTPADVPALPDAVRWVHVAPLARTDFPTETLAALARGRLLSYDGQGLVRVPETGELRAGRRLRPRRAAAHLDAEAERRGGRGARRPGGAARARGRRHARLARLDALRERPAREGARVPAAGRADRRRRRVLDRLRRGALDRHDAVGRGRVRDGRRRRGARRRSDRVRRNGRRRLRRRPRLGRGAARRSRSTRRPRRR